MHAAVFVSETDGYLHIKPCRKIPTNLQTVCTSNDVYLIEHVLQCN
jgi:hypothetical protein